jgi:hypothetical protein
MASPLALCGKMAHQSATENAGILPELANPGSIGKELFLRRQRHAAASPLISR